MSFGFQSGFEGSLWVSLSRIDHQVLLQSPRTHRRLQHSRRKEAARSGQLRASGGEGIPRGGFAEIEESGAAARFRSAIQKAEELLLFRVCGERSGADSDLEACFGGEEHDGEASFVLEECRSAGADDSRHVRFGGGNRRVDEFECEGDWK